MADVGLVTTFSVAAPPGAFFLRVFAVNACGMGAPSAETVVVVGSPVVPPRAPGLGGAPWPTPTSAPAAPSIGSATIDYEAARARPVESGGRARWRDELQRGWCAGGPLLHPRAGGWRRRCRTGEQRTRRPGAVAVALGLGAPLRSRRRGSGGHAISFDHGRNSTGAGAHRSAGVPRRVLPVRRHRQDRLADRRLTARGSAHGLPRGRQRVEPCLRADRVPARRTGLCAARGARRTGHRRSAHLRRLCPLRGRGRVPDGAQLPLRQRHPLRVSLSDQRLRPAGARWPARAGPRPPLLSASESSGESRDGQALEPRTIHRAAVLRRAHRHGLPGHGDRVAVPGATGVGGDPGDDAAAGLHVLLHPHAQRQRGARHDGTRRPRHHHAGRVPGSHGRAAGAGGHRLRERALSDDPAADSQFLVQTAGAGAGAVAARPDDADRRRRQDGGVVSGGRRRVDSWPTCSRPWAACS